MSFACAKESLATSRRGVFGRIGNLNDSFGTVARVARHERGNRTGGQRTEHFMCTWKRGNCFGASVVARLEVVDDDAVDAKTDTTARTTFHKKKPKKLDNGVLFESIAASKQRRSQRGVHSTDHTFYFYLFFYFLFFISFFIFMSFLRTLQNSVGKK